MTVNFGLIAEVIFAIWLIILSTFFWQLFSHYNRLSKGAQNKNLKTILEELLKTIDIAQKDIVALKSRCDTIEQDGLFHIQKIGLLRFNPFKDTGGDQSFILALVNGNNTGVVISGLYSRSGTRWYAKKVLNGKGIEHELSEEEKKALKEAQSM